MTLVEIRAISFQVQEWIRTGSYKEWHLFPEETKNSWKKRVIGKFPGSCQDLKQDFRLKTPGSPFYVNQDPGQEVYKSWEKRVIEKSPRIWQDSKQDYITILLGFSLKSDIIFAGSWWFLMRIKVNSRILRFRTQDFLRLLSGTH